MTRADGDFCASGIYAQGIHIDLEADLAIVVLNAWTAATGSYAQHRNALFAAIEELVQ